jgi:hypothetical protein
MRLVSRLEILEPPKLVRGGPDVLASWLGPTTPVGMFVPLHVSRPGEPDREVHTVYAVRETPGHPGISGVRPPEGGETVAVPAGKWLFGTRRLTHHSADRTAKGDRWANVVGRRRAGPPNAAGHDGQGQEVRPRRAASAQTRCTGRRRTSVRKETQSPSGAASSVRVALSYIEVSTAATFARSSSVRFRGELL